MTKRMGAALVATALAVMLAGCLLTPGKFMSTLDIRNDGQFSFTYKGEIHLLALSKLAAAGNGSEKKPFELQPCHGDDGADRPCTAAETADQKSAWAEEQKAAAEKAKRESQQAKAFFGGIDPADPRAAQELANRLRRQAGFRTVTYKGDGLFDVDFAIGGRLDHDFVFPTIERFAMANAFVQVSRRNDGTVRVDAPGFASAPGAMPLAGLMQMSDAPSKGGASAPQMPVPDGQFTITTNGTILANNTDEGPTADPAGKRLNWIVAPGDAAAPTALIRLGN